MSTEQHWGDVPNMSDSSDDESSHIRPQSETNDSSSQLFFDEISITAPNFDDILKQSLAPLLEKLSDIESAVKATDSRLERIDKELETVKSELKNSNVTNERELKHYAGLFENSKHDLLKTKEDFENTKSELALQLEKQDKENVEIYNMFSDYEKSMEIKLSRIDSKLSKRRYRFVVLITITILISISAYVMKVNYFVNNLSSQMNTKNEILNKTMIEMHNLVIDLNKSTTTQEEFTKLEDLKNGINIKNNELKQELKDTKNELKLKLENAEKHLLKTKVEFTKQVNEVVVEASPPGTIAYFTAATPSRGWLNANGQSVSRTTYANLFATIDTVFGSGDGSTTFNLPDLRGEFIRGWSDDKNGVDKDRKFGSFQFGSSIPFVGIIDTSYLRSIAGGYHGIWSFAGQSFDNGFEENIFSNETRDGITFPNDIDSIGVFYANATNFGRITTWNVMKGTRPRNIALLACIKY